MPAEQFFGGERGAKLLSRVELHRDNALYVAVGGRQCTRIHAEPAGEGGGHGVLVEFSPSISRI
jgi:hypothetical protein